MQGKGMAIVPRIATWMANFKISFCDDRYKIGNNYNGITIIFQVYN
jgi:hypothetical protein